MPRVRKIKRKSEVPSSPHMWIFNQTEYIAANCDVDVATSVANICMEALRDAEGKILLTKSGPGVATIFVSEETLPAGLPGSLASWDDMVPASGEPDKAVEPAKTKVTYKRIALAGDEQMTFAGVYMGKRDGLIVKMLAAEGQILGVNTEVTCEIALSKFVVGYKHGESLVGGAFLAALETLGPDYSSIATGITEIAERSLREKKNVELVARQEAVEKRKAEYADTQNWGAW